MWFPAPDNRQADLPLRRRGWLPSPTTTLKEQVSPLSEPPAMAPEPFQSLMICHFWKSTVQGPGREAVWVHRRKSSNYPGRFQPYPTSGRSPASEGALASLGSQIAAIYFPFVKSNQNQHVFTDIFQVLN